MILRNPQESAVARAQQFVLIHQLKPRVEVVLVEEVHGGLERVAVQVMYLAGRAHVVAPPDEGRSPVAAIERVVVLNRGGRAPDVSIRLLRFGAAEEAVGDLCSPVPVRHEPEAGPARGSPLRGASGSGFFPPPAP